MRTPGQPWAGVKLGAFKGYQLAMQRQERMPDAELAEGLKRHRHDTVAGMAEQLRALYLTCCAKRHDDILALPAACPMIEGNLGCGHGMDALPDGRVGAQRLLWEGCEIAGVLGYNVAFDDLLLDPKDPSPARAAGDVVRQRFIQLQIIDRAAIRGYRDFHGGDDMHEVASGVKLAYHSFQALLRSAEAEHGGVLLELRGRVGEAFGDIGRYGERLKRQSGRPAHAPSLAHRS